MPLLPPTIELTNNNRFIKITDVNDYSAIESNLYPTLRFFIVDFLASSSLIEGVVPYNRTLSFSNASYSSTKSLLFLNDVSTKNMKKDVLYIPFFIKGMYRVTLISIPTGNHLETQPNNYLEGDVIYDTPNFWRAYTDNPEPPFGFEDLGTIDNLVDDRGFVGNEDFENNVVSSYDTFINFADHIEVNPLYDGEDKNLAYSWEFFDLLSTKQKDCLIAPGLKNINTLCEKVSCDDLKRGIVGDFAKRAKMYKDYINPLDASYNTDYELIVNTDVIPALNKLCKSC